MTTASVYLGCLMSFQVSSSHGRRPLMFDGYRIVQPCTVSSEVNRKKTLKEDTTTTKQKGKTPKKISNPRAIEPRYLLPLNHRPSFHSHPLASSSCFLYIQRQINRLFFLLFFSLRISFFFQIFQVNSYPLSLGRFAPSVPPRCIQLLFVYCIRFFFLLKVLVLQENFLFKVDPSVGRIEFTHANPDRQKRIYRSTHK